MSDEDDDDVRVKNPILAVLPVPKYRVGDKVWAFRVEHGWTEFPCPDCLGAKTWSVKNAAGFEGNVQCPRCRGEGVLKQESRCGKVEALTIGTIKVMTHKHSSDSDYVEYMCEETGIGSGSIWYECRLVLTKEEALECARVACEEELLTLEKRLTSRQKAERADFRMLSTYQLRDAEIKEADMKAFRAGYRTQYLLERIARLEPHTYCMSPETLREDGEGRASGQPLSGLTVEDVRLIVDELCSGDDENTEWLRKKRAEDKECKC